MTPFARIERRMRLSTCTLTALLAGPSAAIGLPADLIFADGWEIGSLRRWSTCTGCPPAQFPGGHPRLFVTPSLLEELRAAVLVPGSTHQQAYSVLKAKVDSGTWQAFDEDPADGNYNYARSYFAQAASLVYLVTGAESYADDAYRMLMEIYEEPDPDFRLPTVGYGLSRATVGLGLALTYDWAFAGLNSAQRADLRLKVELALDTWPAYVHGNLRSSHLGSNWVAVCRGAELIEMLAIDEEVARATRFEQLKSWLSEHLRNGYGPTGTSQEGIGYVGYGGIFLLPAIYALRSVGDSGLESILADREFWKLAMFSGTFSQDVETDRRFLQSGVSDSRINDEGWASLLFNTVPDDQLAYYLHFYDRHMGRLAPGAPDEKYDDDRQGAMWTLLYYPVWTTARDPFASLGPSLVDESRGLYLFRNGWNGEDDIQISLSADVGHHDASWDEAEAFQLGIHAYGSLFAGGPAKSRNAANMSVLLVDGKAAQHFTHTGAIGSFVPSLHGGYVVVGGGRKYAELGLVSAERHLLVDFSGMSAPALLSTLDVLSADSPHDYTWQLNLGNQDDDGGIFASQSSSEGVPTFTLWGASGSYLKGWVMHPGAATIVTGDPMRVRVRASEAQIWIVMALGQGAPPIGTLGGTGMTRTLSLGGASVRLEEGRIRADQPGV